jgi:sulfur carrier protein ThiS
MITIHDTETDKTTTREMTPEELSGQQSILNQIEAQKAEIAEAEAKKAALLAKLGITAEEAALLLG